MAIILEEAGLSCEPLALPESGAILI